MPIFSASLGSFTSISFLSTSQSQSHLSPFKLTVKTPWQWQHHHYLTSKVLVSASGNTQIPNTELLQRPTPPDPLDDARQARVLSFLFILLNFSSHLSCNAHSYSSYNHFLILDFCNEVEIVRLEGCKDISR